MKPDHPNAKLMDDTMKRAGSEGPQVLLELLADDVVWHEVDNPEPLRGKQAVVDAMMAAGPKVQWDFEPFGTLADDDTIVSFGRAHLTSDGREVTYSAVDIAKVREGRVVERWAMVDDLDGMRAFWNTL